ncbi:DUF6036 family nucleotidyltransferase [Thermohalobacter berrensis]|uniref:DUF6036 domain-containing protein n=1 Tax=Thermohalobacter berrensis TaxID=99594 RepID=A0A419T409_9FIRM|nr:DUF6036 family nucleotidyltransferase [Thermohalobacter berrensis]RKD32290.1 hypothetical protein BET03_02980 [Thermohalobacter berrensis]
MNIKKQLEEKLYEMEKVAKVFDIEPFDMYLLGGCACILAGYSDRATRDFDFIDLNYSSKLAKVFVHLREFDMLEYESTLISPKYKSRATKLEQFKYLNIYVLSIEDIIVSKIIRLSEKDLQDIDLLIEKADKKLINKIIEEVINRKDLFEIKKKEFKSKLKIFRERYDV